jgi:hypothetical protein
MHTDSCRREEKYGWRNRNAYINRMYVSTLFTRPQRMLLAMTAHRSLRRASRVRLCFHKIPVDEQVNQGERARGAERIGGFSRESQSQ